jgi:hypothetical protein
MEDRTRALLEEVRRGEAALRELIGLASKGRAHSPGPQTAEAAYRGKPPSQWGTKRRSEPHPKTIGERVLDFYRAQPAGRQVGIDEVHRAFPGVLRRSLLSAMHNMSQEGRMEAVGHGFYRLPVG